VLIINNYSIKIIFPLQDSLYQPLTN